MKTLVHNPEMGNLRELVAELLEEVRRVDPSAIDVVRPGVPPERVERRFAALPYEISPDAAALYQVLNCAEPLLLGILPGTELIGFDRAFQEFEEIHGIRDELEEICPEPYRDCFRFLTDRADGGYAFGRIDSPSRGQIISLEIHAPWMLAFASLDQLLKTSIECYRQGILRAESEPADFHAYYRLAATMNPEMEKWTDWQRRRSLYE